MAVSSKVVAAALALVAMPTLSSCQVPSAEHADAELLACSVGKAAELGPGLGRARLRWVHHTDEGFRVESAVISMDGRPVYESHDREQLQRELTLLPDVDVPPGQHRLDSTVSFSGSGTGIFSYLKGYRAEKRSSAQLSLDQGEVRCLSLMVWYRDGLTLPLEQRPEARLVLEPKP